MYENIIGKEKTIKEYENDRECPMGCQYCVSLKGCYEGYINERNRLIGIIEKSKKEVFDDVYKIIESSKFNLAKLEERHLSTLQKQSDIIADKQNPQDDNKKSVAD